MPFTEGKGILRGKIGFADLTWWTGVSAYVYTYVRASAIARRTAKRTCDYPTLNHLPYRFFTHNHPFFFN
jgi:hypothetical protein